MTNNSILGWSRAVLTTTPARFLSLVNALPLELLTMQPAPNEWSALQCLHHLVVLERSAQPGRVTAFLNGDAFPIVDFAAAKAEVPTPALAAEFEACRAASLVILDQVTESDLKRELRHPTLGLITLEMFLHHWAGHDLMHTVQAERALMQPFIRGVGPWRANYTDHIAQS